MQRLDEFMGDALFQYYNNRDPLGVDGDFTTAPEISQLFGEMIGIWAAKKWMTMGSPSHLNLIEIGPGRGTLMADLLRGTHHIDAFHKSISVHLVETSATLKAKQQKTLGDYDIQWHEHLSEIDNTTPAIIIANEFFDALPIRQFKYEDGAWLEHYIDNKKSIWFDAADVPIKNTLPAPNDVDIFEYSSMQEEYAKLISAYHGGAIIIDYGYKKSAYGDTLQALYKHEYCSITDHIGDADLTTHIDFKWLSGFFKGGTITTQRDFLKTNGIDIRYQHLNDPSLKSGYERLIGEMGDLFKVLEV